MARMPKLWGAYSGRGVGAPWSMGMGQHLGRQVWTGQDKQDKPQNAHVGRGVSRSKSSHRS